MKLHLGLGLGAVLLLAGANAAAAGVTPIAQLRLQKGLTLDDLFFFDNPVAVQAQLQDSGTDSEGTSFSYEARGSASLATGAIRGFTSVNNFNTAGFRGDLTEEVFVEGTPNTEVDAIFEVELTGTLDVSTSGDTGRSAIFDASLLTGAGLNTKSARYRHLWNFEADNLGGGDVFFPLQQGNVEIVAQSADLFHVILRTTETVFIGEDGKSSGIRVQLSALGDVSALDGFALIDAENTAQLGIVLPTGYSFSSASGTLLTQPVPIPGALALFAPAVLMTALRARRRRR